VLLLCLVCIASAKPLIVNLPGGSVQLRAEVADFGYQFDSTTGHTANLLLAPEEDPFLCSYPTSLQNLPPRDASSPIALFVSRGECSFEEKAMVALEIQRNFTQDLQYVIIYNNDRENPSQLIRMGATNLTLPTLGFVAVSTRAGSYTMSSIMYYSSVSQQSPYIGADVNETNGNWEYPIDIEEWNSGNSRGGSRSATTFYLLRFVLFTVLILAPCLRAGYLWFHGGGRIAFRRNDRGWIIGLEYINPVPYWFAPSAQTHDAPRRAQLLTQAQVLGLPEITFVKTHDDDDDDSASNTSVESDTMAVEPEIVVTETDEEQVQICERPTDHNEESPQNDGAPLFTTCTMCSICIDNFEDGEKIRLLPKCKHGFHTDCLMPWLTERQGCCPLCKRSVLGPDDEDSDYEDENRDVETGVELVNQGQPVPNEEYTESRNGDETEEPVSSDETGTGMMESEIQIQPSSPSPSDDALEVPMPVEPVSNVAIIEEQNADHVGEEVASIVEEPEIQVEPHATSKDSSDIDSGAAATVAEVNDPGQAHEKSETQDQNTRSELHSLV
jgi:hypothetical protein